MRCPHPPVAEKVRSPHIALVTTHIAPAKGYGGIAVSSARLAKAWSDDAHVFLSASDASLGSRLTSADLNMPATMKAWLYHAYGWRRWGFGMGAFVSIWRCCRMADAVYVSGIATWPTSLAPLICHMLRRPVTVAVRGGLMTGHIAYIRATKPWKWLFYRLITLPALRCARAIHATSDLEAEGVRALLPHVPVAVVPNAIDLSTWPLMPPRTADGGLTIGYVGRLSPEKGVLPFMQAWLEVRGPRDRLRIAGAGDGEYAEQINRMADQAGDAVERLGYLPMDGVRTMLAGCDYLVLPSGMGEGGLRENFGNSVIEAMALGRPVLVSRGMAWDEVEPQGAGFAFSSEQAGEVIRRAAATSTAQREAMGQAARQFVEARFDINIVAQQLRSVVLGQADGTPSPT